MDGMTAACALFLFIFLIILIFILLFWGGWHSHGCSKRSEVYTTMPTVVTGDRIAVVTSSSVRWSKTDRLVTFTARIPLTMKTGSSTEATVRLVMPYSAYDDKDINVSGCGVGIDPTTLTTSLSAQVIRGSDKAVNIEIAGIESVADDVEVIFTVAGQMFV